MAKVNQEIEVGGRTLTLETGELAGQASCAVVARLGDTMVLVTVVASKIRPDLDYFPLTVEYMERLYAGGKIKGSRWVKREGRPSDDEILSARLIDRSIRPLFPKDYKNEVQVITTVLSVDGENDPTILSMVATSAALSASPIPWNGPVASLRIGAKNGNFFANPLDSELELSEMDLVATFSCDAVLMIEAAARQVSEERILGALEFGQKEAQKIIAGIEEFAKKVGAKKIEVEKLHPDSKLLSEIETFLKKHEKDQIVKTALIQSENEVGYSQLLEILAEELGEEYEKQNVATLFSQVWREKIRQMVLSGKRPDGRKADEVRPISGSVGILPRTHGSAIFQRGQTQVLTTTTLGSPSLEQLIESAEGEATKRYIHHYSMPPYSVGETGRIGFPSRREIGHGALAERALFPVIPPNEKFPYTIRVVSEILSSNGSTSMAATCGSTMSLMDAGVPIVAPVSGIAMGLVVADPKKFVILSDITGLEDVNGDMDFKIAGTKEGLTAVQLDVKTDQLTLEILKPALAQAREGRLSILEKMLSVIKEPRPKLSAYAPKIVVVRVPTEKIGEIIGPGGRIIRKIMAETGATIDVEDDGSVNISGVTEESVEKARAWVEGLVKEVAAGEIYEGEVKRILPFGAFVEVLPGKEGLVHVSDMAQEFVKDPADKVSLGDKVKVRVKEIDDLGRINLSMLLSGDKPRPPREAGGQREYRPARRGLGPRPSHRLGERTYGPEGPRRSFSRRPAGPEGRPATGGPHFPASRFLPSKRRF